MTHERIFIRAAGQGCLCRAEVPHLKLCSALNLSNALALNFVLSKFKLEGGGCLHF